MLFSSLALKLLRGSFSNRTVPNLCHSAPGLAATSRSSLPGIYKFKKHCSKLAQQTWHEGSIFAIRIASALLGLQQLNQIKALTVGMLACTHVVQAVQTQCSGMSVAFQTKGRPGIRKSRSSTRDVGREGTQAY